MKFKIGEKVRLHRYPDLRYGQNGDLGIGLIFAKYNDNYWVLMTNDQATYTISVTGEALIKLNSNKIKERLGVK